MKLLVVDAGNHSLKVALFSGRRMVVRSRASYSMAERLSEHVRRWGYEKGLIVSTVYELNGYLKVLFPRASLLVPRELDLPSAYSLRSLGPDRLAASYPFIRRGESAVVVVCGSAITLNVVYRGIFYGGPIFPSPARLSSVYRSFSFSSLDLHRDSVKAVEDGIKMSVVGGIREALRWIDREFSIEKKYITGRCPFALRVGGKVVPDLVLIGGRWILEDALL